MEISTTFCNQSPLPVSLEALTSFSLGGITSFDEADASGKLQVHRFRSAWSAEGRLETPRIEELHMERSWSGGGVLCERFGQVGSLPVRGWFPFLAATDTAAGVTWGAQLAWPGSWQMEIFRQHDDLCLSGGLGGSRVRPPAHGPASCHSQDRRRVPEPVHLPRQRVFSPPWEL